MTVVRSVILILMALLFMGGVCAFADDTEDATTAWKRWKSIEAAITVRPLDGPDDIIEKAEIIEDRADELKGEKARLEREADLNRQKLRTLRSQREVLQDLAEIKPGGDAQTRNRLQDVAERIGREEMLLKMRRQSAAELEEELVQMNELAVEYREKARDLIIQERGAP
jgi:hypothetical protein